MTSTSSCAKLVGWALRNVGDHDPARLDAFLDAQAAGMPRSTLRNAIEKLTPEERQRLLGLGRAG